MLLRNATLLGAVAIGATAVPATASAQDTTTKICLPTNPAKCVPPGPAVPSRRGDPEPGQPYFEFMVDQPVREAARTARPRYPDSLKVHGVQGQVLAQFVVDTMGQVEPSTFRVLASTHDEFTAAVRGAMPGFAYEPARRRGQKVRQLVQQPFVFAISGAEQSAPALPRPMMTALPQLSNTVSPAPPQGTVKGWVFTQRMTVDSGNGRTPIVFTSRYTGTGGKARSETEIAPPVSPGGPLVTIMDSSARTITLVMSAANISMIGPMPALPARTARTVASDTASQYDLGPGEPILGHPTTRRQIVVTSTVTESLGAIACTRTTKAEITLWRIADSTVSTVQRAMAMSLGGALGGGSDVAQAIERASKRRIDGSVVRAVLRQATGAPAGAPDGAQRVVTMTMDVIEARFGDVDAALFAVPAGSRLMASTDSTMNASRQRQFWRQHDSTETLPNGQKACVRR
jgi:TonB family protein